MPGRKAAPPYPAPFAVGGDRAGLEPGTTRPAEAPAARDSPNPKRSGCPLRSGGGGPAHERGRDFSLS
jgi:hypothetical protein